MASFFNPRKDVISIEGTNIFIDTSRIDQTAPQKPFEIDYVIHIVDDCPSLQVYEDNVLVRTYNIEPTENGLKLNNNYLHVSLRISTAFQMDSILSEAKVTTYKLREEFREGIRFQPFFIPFSGENNNKLKGLGLLTRGLHFPARVTPGSIRLCYICDYCAKSFTVRTFHAGFSDVEYFYSNDSAETLVLPFDQLKYVPPHTDKKIDIEKLKVMEEYLPYPKFGKGKFKYFNSFKCPYCLKPYIDFESHPEIRPHEYYGIYSLPDRLKLNNVD